MNDCLDIELIFSWCLKEEDGIMFLLLVPIKFPLLVSFSPSVNCEF